MSARDYRTYDPSGQSTQVSDESLKKIFPYGISGNQNSIRLFCFHYAGGSSAAFCKWKKQSSVFEVIPVELPGRGGRRHDLYESNFEKIVSSCADSIMQVNDERPFCIYGHSMGALIAFETVYYLERQYDVQPAMLFVTGKSAPDDHQWTGNNVPMDYEMIKKSLIYFGKVDEKIVENKIFQKLFLPTVLNDYRLLHCYRYLNHKIFTPIIAMGGNRDDLVDSKQVSGWRNMTNGSFKQYEFEGDHFFPFEESKKKVLELIEEKIQNLCMKKT